MPLSDVQTQLGDSAYVDTWLETGRPWYIIQHGAAIMGFFDPDDSSAVLAGIRIEARAAGELDGFRVGDSAAAVLRKWGPPTMMDDSAAPFVIDYDVGNWAIQLVTLNGVISRIEIAWIPDSMSNREHS
jgi:hypothetical protein